MVKFGKISGSVALDSFRELDDFIKNKKEQAKKEIAEFIEDSLVKDIFEVHQEFTNLPRRGSRYDDILKRGNWFNIIDIIKSLITSIENPNIKGINIEETSKLIRSSESENYGNINSINNLLLNLSKEMISYDIKNKCLVFNTAEFISVNIKEKYRETFVSEYNLSFQLDEDGKVFTNGIKLLKFSKFSSVGSIIENADDPLVFQFLKYISGIITVEDLASTILVEIETEVSEVVSRWATNITEENLYFHLFPADFYSKKQIINFLVENEYNFKTLRGRGFFNALYNSNSQNNNYLRTILDESFNIKNIKDDIFFSFLGDEREDIVQGYSELNSEDKKKIIFSKLNEFQPFKENNSYDIDLLKIFGDDETLSFIKNTYKFLINKLKSDIPIKEGEENCLLVDLNGQTKYVKFYEDIFSNHTYKLSESQLSEFKSELIPILEEIQDKIYIFYNKNRRLCFDSQMSIKDVLQIIDVRNSYIFSNLFNILDWYPKKLKFITDFLEPGDFVKSVEKFTFINKMNESENCDISVIFISEGEQNCIHENDNYYTPTKDWVFKRYVQLSAMIKRKITNGLLVSECCTENFEEKQKFLDIVLSYNTNMPIYELEIKE